MINEKLKIIIPGLVVEYETREYGFIGPEFLKEVFFKALHYILYVFFGLCFQ